MTPFTLPDGLPRIKRVGSFEELVSTRFSDGVNALCWQRDLPGDFAEITRLLHADDAINSVDESHLRSLPLEAAGKIAVEILLEDQRLMREHGLSPSLECIRRDIRDEEPVVFSRDVYSFHADSATDEADTFLCTYHGPCSEGIRNEDARRRVDLPETRAELLKLHGGQDDEGFLQFLSENSFDLHYAPIPPAVPFSFGNGNLWRIAIAYPGCPVPPCIHRAPHTLPGQSRLLLIS